MGLPENYVVTHHFINRISVILNAASEGNSADLKSEEETLRAPRIRDVPGSNLGLHTHCS